MAGSSVAKLTERPLGRVVGRFGAPLVLGMMLHTMFNLVDMYMISRLPRPSAALAGVGIVDIVAAAATILANGISTATVALIGRRTGEGDRRGVRRIAYQSLLLTGLLSVVFGVIGLFANRFVVEEIMQTKGEAASIATGYLQIMLGGCFSVFLLLQLSAILRAVGDSRSAAAILIGGNAVNILLGVLLIYGPGPHPPAFAWAAPIAQALHVPRLEVMGAGWATLLGRSAAVVAGILLLARRRQGPRFHSMYLRPLRAELGRIVRLAWPSSTQLVVRVVGILVVMSLVSANFTTADDPSALTAFSICLRLETVALFVSLGWGAGASALVAIHLGANLPRRALYAGWTAAGYSILFTGALTIFYLLCTSSIIGFFDDVAAVTTIGREYLFIVGPSYVLIGVAVVLSQGIAGAGATLSALLIDTVVVLLLFVPAAVLVAETLDLGRAALWWTVATGNVVSALAYIFWYARGGFLSKRV